MPTVAAVVSMAVFSATLLPYFAAQRSGTVAGYAPLVAGTLVAACLVGFVTYTATPFSSTRILSALGAAVAVASAFTLLFFFVVLNTLGS
ncbi:MAG: hypothetical protein K2X00_17150 [Nitrospiraceae bacterium]|nr:hypothetical protein [Nitrospiraceae bacterium]